MNSTETVDKGLQFMVDMGNLMVFCMKYYKWEDCLNFKSFKLDGRWMFD